MLPSATSRGVGIFPHQAILDVLCIYKIYACKSFILPLLLLLPLSLLWCVPTVPPVAAVIQRFSVDMYDFCHFLQRIRSNQHISQFDVLMQYIGGYASIDFVYTKYTQNRLVGKNPHAPWCCRRQHHNRYHSPCSIFSPFFWLKREVKGGKPLQVIPFL